MSDFDVFNGDADGICALLQLRLNEPRQTTLVTGVKRDIELLEQVQAKANDRVTVLDVSMDKNRDDLIRILEAGADVFYVDHHFAGEVPQHTKLKTLINEAADTCTSILVNGHLKGKFTNWAITGAFGDNLKGSALALAKAKQLTDTEVTMLEQLGTYINYNGYGSDLEDLHVKPAELFNLLLDYADPLDFIRANGADFRRLQTGYNDDMASAQNLEPELKTEKCAIYILPEQAWARRISGVYGNDLANQNPDRAHAVLTEKANGNYLVSVRAPLTNKRGAVDLCNQFPTGGGRAAAAGINDLPKADLQHFWGLMQAQYT